MARKRSLSANAGLGGERVRAACDGRHLKLGQPAVPLVPIGYIPGDLRFIGRPSPALIPYAATLSLER